MTVRILRPVQNHGSLRCSSAIHKPPPLSGHGHLMAAQAFLTEASSNQEALLTERAEARDGWPGVLLGVCKEVLRKTFCPARPRRPRIGAKQSPRS